MSGAGRKVDDMRPEFGPLAAGERIAALAGRQYGVVSRVQLRDLGLSDRAISRRLADGRLLHMHHGVYAVGHSVLTVRGRWMSAVLAGGPGAVLSHASAAAFWELRRSSAVLIDVTTRRTGRARPGLRIHRPRTLRPDETTIKDAIPVTTPARLIVEADAWRYHKTRRAFEDDRARDVLTTKAGYRTLRFTDRQLADDPHSVAAAIRATLRS